MTNPILKAHLEGRHKLLEEVSMAIANDPYKLSTYEYNYICDALTTYGTNLLKAALEAGPGKLNTHFLKGTYGSIREKKVANLKAWNSCLSSFRSAIEEGIKEIRNN